MNEAVMTGAAEQQFNEKQLVQENEYAVPCHWLLRRATRERYGQVTKLLAAQIRKHAAGGAVLDIGCGDGRGTYDLRAELGDGYSFLGVDFSKRAILFARAFADHTPIQFEHVRAERLSGALGNRRFKVVVLRDVIEHLDLPELRACLSDAFALLEDDGTLVFSVPSVNDPVLAKHFRHYDAPLVTQHLGENGFAVDEIVGYVYQPYWLGYLLRPLVDAPVIWRLYRPFLRTVKPRDAKMLLGSALKKKPA